MSSRSTTDCVSDVAVVIRSVGERTESLCAQLASQQVGESRVVVIHEQPFSRAVRKCFQIGLDFGQEWTLALDADVLLLPNAIRILKTFAENMPANYFECEVDVLDKLLGHPRPGGPHLYRTSMLEAALPFVSDAEILVRPEAHVKLQMAARGYPYVFESALVAIHDYEQYYGDIYRKAFVHAHKHRERVGYAKSMWQRLAGDDPDYLVALLGLQAGQKFEGAATIDRRRFPDQIDALLQAHDLQEKEELSANVAEMGIRIKGIVDAYEPPPEYIAWQDSQLKQERRSVEYKAKRQALGFPRFLVWVSGRVLQRIGREIESLAEKRFR